MGSRTGMACQGILEVGMALLFVITMQLLTRMAMDSSTNFQAPPQAAYFL